LLAAKVEWLVASRQSSGYRFQILELLVMPDAYFANAQGAMLQNLAMWHPVINKAWMPNQVWHDSYFRSLRVIHAQAGRNLKFRLFSRCRAQDPRSSRGLQKTRPYFRSRLPRSSWMQQAMWKIIPMMVLCAK
jgi:hypothetical protein